MDENQIKEQEQEQEKKVQDMRSIVEKQEERIQSLQSNAFELANFYFVFQGVILTAISKAHISPITCSHRWLLFTLSLLAAFVNLVALFTIGRRYMKTLSQQHENQLEHHEVVQRLDQLRRLPGQSHSPRPPNSENLVPYSKDRATETKRRFVFVICILLFLGFAGVTMAGCWRIPCSRNEYCRRLPENENCINLCDGPKCIRVCSAY